MSGLLRACLALAVLTGPALAKEDIWAEAFVGTYERVGRDAATPPGLVDDKVFIAAEGDGLSLRQCGAGLAQTPVQFEFVQLGDITNLLHAAAGPSEMWCLYHNNGDNMLILTCTTPEGARLTYWPKLDQPCAD